MVSVCLASVSAHADCVRYHPRLSGEAVVREPQTHQFVDLPYDDFQIVREPGVGEVSSLAWIAMSGADYRSPNYDQAVPLLVIFHDP